MSGLEIRLAYLFWLPSLFGVAGLHRFYLGKPLSGLLYLMTAGLFGIGTIYDALTMPQQVRTARLARRLDDLLEERYTVMGGRPERRVGPMAEPQPQPRSRRPRSLDQAILGLAEVRHGVVTPSRVALEANVSPEKARDQLDRLVGQGFADVEVSANGVMVYVFREFLDDIGRAEIDSL